MASQPSFCAARRRAALLAPPDQTRIGEVGDGGEDRVRDPEELALVLDGLAGPELAHQ